MFMNLSLSLSPSLSLYIYIYIYNLYTISNYRKYTNVISNPVCALDCAYFVTSGVHMVCSSNVDQVRKHHPTSSEYHLNIIQASPNVIQTSYKHDQHITKKNHTNIATTSQFQSNYMDEYIIPMTHQRRFEILKTNT